MNERDTEQIIRDCLAEWAEDAERTDRPSSHDLSNAEMQPVLLDPPRHGRRVLVAAAAAGLVIALVVVLAVARPDVQHRVQSQPSNPTTVSSGSTQLAEEPTVPSTSLQSVPPVTALDDATAGITRPYLDPSICADGSKHEDAFTDPVEIYPFAHGRESGIPMQVIGDPTGGPAQPYAIVIRYFTTHTHNNEAVDVNVNGVSVGITTFPTGIASAQWDLPDGSNAYMRSLGFDQAEIVEILHGLTARDRSEAIPGFDFQRDPEHSGAPLALIAESLNTFTHGSTSSYRCITPDSSTHTIDAVQGDPMYVYWSALERPAPLEIATSGDGALILSGHQSPTAPRLADVIQADATTWNELPTFTR